MRKKQEEFYKTYHKLGRTDEAAEVALGKVYSIKTWSKANRKKQLDKLLCSDEGRLYLDSLEKTKKVRKKLEKTSGGLEKSLEKTASDSLEKNKGGRPTLYSSSLDSVAREILALGGHDLDVQAALGVSAATYYRWKIDHPPFLAAVRSGRHYHLTNKAEEALLKRVEGYVVEYEEKELDADGRAIRRQLKCKVIPSDTPAIKYALNNREPDLWSDRPELKTGTGNDNDEERKKLDEQTGEQREVAEKILEELNSGTLTEE